LQAFAVGVGDAQWCADKALNLGHSDGAHQGEAVGVGADQNVLAVVQYQPRRVDTASAATELRRHLEQRDLMAQAYRLDGCSYPGPATAHNRDLSALRRRH
jgi:hypothetical protein